MQIDSNLTVEDWLGKDNQLGIDIWHKKYQYNNESFYQWLNRVSGNNKEIAQLILDKKFLFGGRILATRGIDNKIKHSMSNCYVLPAPQDNLESIYDTCKYLARTYSYGGGCGLSISDLAPEGAKVNNQAKSSTGAVSFMDTFSQVTETIGQHNRRGALMISIDCTHPDLEKFIKVKTDLNKINFANISVCVSDAFMQAVENDEDWELYFTRPETNEHISKIVKAKDIFNLICETNWNYAEPGVLFWDTINNYHLQSENPDFHYGGVNPCSEEPLPDFGACLLGSINLSAFVTTLSDGLTPYFDIHSFKECVKICVKALDEIRIEGMNHHPLIQQQICAKNWAQIGLGIMGLADMLIKMHLVYGEEKSIEMCDYIGRVMATTALETSAKIAQERGCYPKFDECVLKSEFYKNHTNKNIDKLVKTHGLANSQLLTIAPTGTLSTLLGISGGIEPVFANFYTRTTKSLHDKDVTYKVYTPIVKQYMEKQNLTDDKELPSYFITSANIPISHRISMQATWQKHIDASISSTINLPNDATVEDVKSIYKLAWKSKLKGITVYRQGCAREGILVTDTTEKNTTVEQKNNTNISNIKQIGLERHLTTGCGSLHVVAFFDENGNLRNTYLSKGSSGGCNNFMIGLSRMISLSARTGASVEQIIDQLNSCGTCPSYAVRRATKNDTSLGASCPVAIGNALKDMQKELSNNINISINNSTNEQTVLKTMNNCPECGGELIHEMGCVTCNSCGYSKCG